MDNKFTEDDYCDIYENKICDNCGKCLEKEGVDIQAIKIEDIAKTVEENKILEEEYLNNLITAQEDAENIIEETANFDEFENIAEAYKKFQQEHNISLDEDEEYVDAFDHIEYLDEDIFDDGKLEDITEEIFPGVRRIKSQSK